MRGAISRRRLLGTVLEANGRVGGRTQGVIDWLDLLLHSFDSMDGAVRSGERAASEVLAT